MFRYLCLNPIAQTGLDHFTREYEKTEELDRADGILVRSASVHALELPENLMPGEYVKLDSRQLLKIVNHHLTKN